MSWFELAPEYSKGMTIWRLSDERKFEVWEENVEKTRYQVISHKTGECFWAPIETLKQSFSKEHPHAGAIAYCKRYGIKWIPQEE